MTSEWHNWSGNVSAQPQSIAFPISEEEVIALVKQANAAESVIRLVGTGHSFVPLCASDGLLISLDNLQGVISTDQRQRQATVWAGSKIHQLGPPLRAAGLAMENMGDIDRQSIAGAIGTGTHGTGRGIGNISTQVVGLRLILASGEVLDCSEQQEPEVFRAAQLSLGALGVITRVTLRLLPTYRLHERTWTMPVADCMAALPDLIADNRHFEFFWLPADDVCADKTLNPTEAEPGQIVQLSQEGESTEPGAVDRYLKQERIGHSDQIFPSERNVLFNEMEFAVPFAAGPDCFMEIRALMQTQFPDVVWPIEYRTLGSDDIYLSPGYQRETVTLSVHQAAELPNQDFFAQVEAIFERYQGRPHWGKLHTQTPAQLKAHYPYWPRFQAIRQRLDPDNRFLNPYLRALLLD